MRVVVVGILAVLSFVPCTRQGLEQTSEARCGGESYGFVCAHGPHLIYQSRQLRLAGATLYPNVVIGGHILRGQAWASPAPEFRSYIDHWLDLAHRIGINTIRPTDFLVGVIDWRDPTTWRNLDYVIAGARARHMFVIMDLSPYRNFLGLLQQSPYDASAWGDFLGFVGHRYSSESAIAYYAIAGEIQAPNGKDPMRVTADQYVSFYRAAFERLHAADGGHHLLSTGGLSHLDSTSGIPWPALFDLPDAGLAAVHTYSDRDRELSLPTVGRWAVQKRKVLIVEEFGFRQVLGDEARAAEFTKTYELGGRYGAAGMVFWNLGPELTPGSYDVNPDTPAVWAAVGRYASTSQSR